MKELIALGLLITLVSACKDDSGVKTGQVFQDCAYVAANERETLAKATKDMSRNDAIAFVAASKSITVEQAKTCFK